MLAVPRCLGGFGSEHFWIDGQRLRAATKAPQRRRPCHSRALLVDPKFPRFGAISLASTDGTGAWGVWFMNEISRSNRIKNVLSLEMARKHARQPRGSPNGHVSKRSNQRPLERLEAENAQLRKCVADLMLQIRALRDGGK